MATELIVVLDMDTREEALQVVKQCGECQWFKVGAQLFTRCGPALVRELQDLGKNIFLDLKYHDIPNTVSKAARAAADLGAGLFTIHAAGGRDMIHAAAAAVMDTPARILAVTVLTSLSDTALRSDIGIPENAAQTVVRFGKMAVECGAHGLVCSPHEIALLREAVGSKAIIVTPGVRPAWAATDDQSRVMTPGEAAKAGADFIVVGRPILRHENPAKAVELIQEELNA